MIKLNLSVIFIMIASFVYGQGNCNNDYLLRITKFKIGGPADLKFAYIDSKQDIIIDFGKYEICFTDTFRHIAFVYSKDLGLYAIDRAEKRLFDVLMVNSKPDAISEGLFRIIKDGKVGFANLKGEVVIEPRFDCANPFVNGLSKVSDECNGTKQKDSTKWKGKNWYYIDKTGNKIK